MYEKFSKVFGMVKADAALKESFNDSFVEKLTISKSTKILRADVVSKTLIPTECKYKIEQAIKDTVGVADKVEINLHYDLADNSAESIFNFMWTDAVEHLSADSPVCGCVLEDCTKVFNDNAVVINVGHNAAYYMYKKGIDNYLIHRIKDQFGIDVNVTFKNKKTTEEDKKVYEDKKESFEKQLISAILSEQVMKETAKENALTDAAQENISKGIIIGKGFTGEPIKIAESKLEGEKVIIEGDIFNLEEKETKSGKYIVTFDITDGSDSTTVKFFTEKKPYDCDGGIKSALKGAYVKVKGDVQADKYNNNELLIMTRDIEKAERPPERMDNSEEKRVELHLHTTMSAMDAVTDVKEYIKRAIKWGHKAIAVTDHGVVQAYPFAMDAADGKDIKVIYGVEGYLIDDLGEVVTYNRGQSFDDEYVVFDIETTGLNKELCKIIEIGAVKIKNREIIDRYSVFIDQEEKLTDEIVNLTHITDDMLIGQRTIKEVLPEFLEFCGNAVLVAHNASFDTGFVRIKAAELGLGDVKNTILDTLELSRTLLKDLKKHKLDVVAKHLGISLEGHHRAVNDAEATAGIFLKLLEMLEENDVHDVDKINVFASRTVNYNKL